MNNTFDPADLEELQTSAEQQPWVRIPVTRADYYPHGPVPVPPHAPIERLDVTHLAVKTNAIFMGSITVAASLDDKQLDSYGFEFHLSTSGARQLAAQLVKAATQVAAQEPEVPFDSSCSLVVVGPPADIGAFEATQAERCEAAWLTDDGRLERRGWPSCSVTRSGSIDDGLVLYEMLGANVHYEAWVQAQARAWPRLEFRVHVRVNDFWDYYIGGVAYRYWLSAAGATKHDSFTDQERELGRQYPGTRWLLEAGISDVHAALKSGGQIIAPSGLATLDSVRQAINDGALARGRPLVATSSGESFADRWYELEQARDFSYRHSGDNADYDATRPRLGLYLLDDLIHWEWAAQCEPQPGQKAGPLAR